MQASFDFLFVFLDFPRRQGSKKSPGREEFFPVDSVPHIRVGKNPYAFHDSLKSNTVIFNVFMLFFLFFPCILSFFRLHFHGADNSYSNYRHHDFAF